MGAQVLNKEVIIVFWNFTESEEKAILNEIRQFEENSLGLDMEDDEMTYDGR